MTIVTISAYEYDITGAITFDNRANDGAAGGVRRFTKTQLTSGATHVFNGGFYPSDQEFSLTIRPHTREEFLKIQIWFERYIQLRLRLFQGVYVGYITQYNQNGNQLNFTFSATGYT